MREPLVGDIPSMNLDSQRRLLLTGAIVTFSVGWMAAIESGRAAPTGRFIIGVGAAFTICSIMVDLGTPAGAAFAMLIMVSALMYQGMDVVRLFNKRAGKRKGGGSSRGRRNRPGQRPIAPDDPMLRPSGPIPT